MGTWGIGTFENDDASDWLYDLEASAGVAFLEGSLKSEPAAYLEAPDAENILAAAEIINGILNGPREGLPENALAWIDAHRDADVAALAPRAVQLIGRVLAGNSELHELWQESDEDYPAWKADVEDLRRRLAG